MIKFIIKNLYYKFFPRSYSQIGEDLIIDNQFGRTKGNFKNLYLDIGAFAPISLSNTYKFYKKKWRGYLVETNKYKCFLMKILRPRDKVINAAIVPNNYNNKKIFFVAKNNFDENEKGILTFDFVKKNDFKKRFFVDAMNINTILEVIFKNEKIKTLKYFKIDTERMDTDIITSINFKKYNFVMIVCEDFLSNYTKYGDIFYYKNSKIYKFLKTKGYVLTSVAGPTCIYLNKNYLKDPL